LSDSEESKHRVNWLILPMNHFLRHIHLLKTTKGN